MRWRWTKVSCDMIIKCRFWSIALMWTSGPRCPLMPLRISLKLIIEWPAYTALSGVSFQIWEHFLRLWEFTEWMRFVWKILIQIPYLNTTCNLIFLSKHEVIQGQILFSPNFPSCIGCHMITTCFLKFKFLPKWKQTKNKAHGRQFSENYILKDQNVLFSCKWRPVGAAEHYSINHSALLSKLDAVPLVTLRACLIEHQWSATAGWA